MSLKLPSNSGQLLGLGYKMDHGLTLEAGPLKITQITPAQLQAALTAFAAAENAFNAGRSAKQAAYDASGGVERAVEEWLGVVKGVLTGRFGARWSTAWAQAGFTNHSTRIPTRIEDRIALAGNLVSFFTTNPSYEVASMGVTAARGSALLDDNATAQNGVTQALSALKTLGQTWETAHAALEDLMWSLIKILQATLEDDDPRWLLFGLPMPGTPQTPEQPRNLAAQLDAAGAILVTCYATPRATRYRWRMRVVGLEETYKLAASSKEPLATIDGVPPGYVAELLVQAVNGDRQSVASEPVLFQMPAAARASETPVAREVAKRSNGNGNGNGHAPAPDSAPADVAARRG